MSSYPNRCQHIKTNGTQCGSPALRRNRFCFFHKRYQDERIRLNGDRRRRGTATFFLPVLEDANSIQMSLQQVVRLLLTGQIEHKTASLLLYALQTASANLRQADFKPYRHDVILDPRDAADSLLDETHLWKDDDFEEEEEIDEVEQEIQEKVEHAAEVARVGARFDAEQAIAARERGRKRYEEEEKLKLFVQKNPRYMLVRDEDGILSTQPRPTEEPKPERQWWEKPTGKGAAQVRAEITDQIRKDLPAITQAYNEAMEREADKAMKKPAGKETLSEEMQEEAE